MAMNDFDLQNYLVSMMSDEEYKQWLAKYRGGRGAQIQGSQFPAMQIGVDSGFLGPRYSGSISSPMFGGVLGLSGNYMSGAAGSPADFGARLNYLRKF